MTTLSTVAACHHFGSSDRTQSVSTVSNSLTSSRPSPDSFLDLAWRWTGAALTTPARTRNRATELLASLWAQSQVTGAREVVLAPQAFPLPNGGLQLEWHGGEDHIELAIDWDGEVELFAESAGGESRVWPDSKLDLRELPFFATSALRRICVAAWEAQQGRSQQ